jgi:uncharacterized membrane protein (DUF106 family)
MDKEPKNIFHRLLYFFDKLEDNVRGHLSHYPIIYTIIGGIAIVLFWRGVWHTADILEGQGGWIGFIFSPVVSMVIVVVILLMTGLFVSYFIGDTILMSGLRGQKKAADKTEHEVKEEEEKIGELRSTVKDMKKEVDEIRDFVEHVKTDREKRD